VKQKGQICDEHEEEQEEVHEEEEEKIYV
jgi:hypothetical protein